MATVAGSRKSLTPDAVERALGVGALLLLAVLLAALIRGRGHLGQIPLLIWVHLATIAIALALTPLLMLRRRGDRWHRRLGWVWCVSMFTTGVVTFGIRESTGRLSFIHLFSVMAIVSVPLIVMAARSHKVEAHRGAVRGLCIGGLLVAGVLTFPDGRLLGQLLFG